MNEQKKKSTPAPHDMVSDNIRLREELAAERKSKFSGLSIILAISLMGNFFMIWLAFFHFPVKSYVWTNNAGAVCNATPLSEPNVSPERVVDFATQATIGIYSFDYENYRRQIATISDKYFTADFTYKYQQLFGDSQLLAMVKDQNYVVSAQQHEKKPPVVSKVFKNGQGIYSWEVQVPVNVNYLSGRRNKQNRMLATVTVVRTDPSPSNKSGIAVDNIITAALIDN